MSDEPILSSLDEFRFETGGDLNRFHKSSTTGLENHEHLFAWLLDAPEYMSAWLLDAVEHTLTRA